MANFEEKTFKFPDHKVTIETTVEDLIGAAINSGLGREEAIMAVHDILDEFLKPKDHRFIMDKIEELV